MGFRLSVLHKRINFDRFAAVKMYQVHREANFVKKRKFRSIGKEIIFCRVEMISLCGLVPLS